MKNIFTLRKFVFFCSTLAIVLGIGQLAKAQPVPENFARSNFWSCRFLHGGSATIGTGAFDADQYNNDTIPAFPSPSQNFAFIGTGGWIKAYWFAPNAIQGIDKIVFYKNTRPLTHCSILHYDAALGTWDTVILRYRGIVSEFYDDLFNLEADSVEIVGCKNHGHIGGGRIPINNTLPPNGPTTIDTLMIADVQCGLGNNPDFREIQFWRRQYACSGNTEIVAGLEGQPATANALNPVLNPCPGFGVHLNAMSAYDDTGHRYQWQINTGAGWADIPGANGMGYFYRGPADASFRVVDTCVLFGTWAMSSTIQVNYAPVPTPNRYFPFSTVSGGSGYVMTFEDPWHSSSCLTSPYANDVPNDGGADRYWANNPPYYFYSWRVDSTSNVTTPTQLTTITNSGWQNVTIGAYNAALNATYPYGVPFINGARRSARLHTSAGNYNPGWSSNLDFYIDFTGVTGDKSMYFYFINRGNVVTNPANSAPNFNNQDTLRVLSSTDGGVTWSTLGVFDTAQFFTKQLVTISSNGPTIIRFQGTKYGTDNSDIGIDSVYIAPQCSGTPVAGRIKASGNGMPAFPFPAGTISVCPGSTLKLTTLGATMAGGLIYEWEQNTNGVTWTPVNGGYNSNSLFFRTPPIYDTVWYRLAMKCGATGTVVYSDTIKVNMSGAGPTYATLPYTQNFESWVNRCSIGDVPVSAGGITHWTNSPWLGNNAWRADNTSTTQSGWGTVNGALPSPYPGLLRAARFHSSQAQPNQKGMLDFLFNGSTANGTKELRFFYVNTTGNDSLEVLYSTDAGSNFSLLASLKNEPAWNQYVMQVPCNTPNCVIRFQGSGDNGNTSDIGIDSVVVSLPCTGKPTAGVITGAVPDPCAGTTFTLNLQNYSNTGGLSFIWESSITDSVSGFTSVYPPNLLDTTKTYFSTSITVPTWFRVIVRCTHSGQADTVVRLITPAHFYYCYCNSFATVPTGPDIGNVKIRRMPSGVNVLNNGSAIPQNNNSQAIRTYTDFRNPPSTLLPTPLYLDSSYELTISQINSGNFTPPGTTVTVWIDTNHNGVFDVNEIFLQGNSVITTLPSQVVSTTFTVPSGMRVGITGMRVMMAQGINLTNLSCGSYTGEGETEDYLVDVRYHPCTGPASAGIAEASDTGVCAGYTVTLVDTTHQTQLYGLRWVWQYSPDSNSWADIAGSLNRDTVVHLVNSETYYRLMMVCVTNFDTTYSNVRKVEINPPYSCYCYSLADGGIKDTSDIGGMYFIGSSGHGVTIPAVGPHLLNPWAINSRTDYTRMDTLHLYLDSVYQLMVYHTLRKGFHADAKITLFMDFNNDLQYNITNNSFNELVWTGFTTSSTFTLVDSIKIPSYAIPGVMSGMRLILNNDTGPNPQSDSACGAYVSGETEDYVVMFHDPSNPYFPTGVSNVSNVSDFRVFPNPTEGRFNVSFEAKNNVKEAKIIVTNIAGQQILGRQVYSPGRKLNEELDLSNMARGLYFVELHADNEKMIKKLIVK